jgi:prephenate dehydratase
MKVAFQGVHGAYSEVAARHLLGRSCHTLPTQTFQEVFEAVEKGRTDRGVIPIENSLAGSIHQNYDLLLRHHLYIVGETHLRIEHVLMCHHESSARNLVTVRSHPQALAQCSTFFARHRRLREIAFFDTAGAAKYIADTHARDTGAIASEYAAKLYGLKILRRHIENQPDNFTRFLAIGRKPWKPTGAIGAKCSLAFRPARNEVGILFKILGVFALRGIDLLKVESRPDPHSPFEYLFYLDLEGSPEKKKVAKALDHLQEMVTHFRLLGVYPMGRREFRDGRRRRDQGLGEW